MGVKFTPDQQRVIDTRERNILVSAAAGSGKTAVLVERIIQKICDDNKPVDIDRLLIVTFTSAAAAQMRERISKAVMKKLEEQPENEHLQKQSALIHNAQITTIDSFCLFVIRNNFNEIGLDPGFRVADEGEIKLLESDILASLLEDSFAQASERFLRFVECYSTGKGEKKIEEAILRLYHFAMSYPFPEEWLLERKQDYLLESLEELPRKPWFQGAMSYLHTVLGECLSRLHQGLALAESMHGPIQYRENLIADIELIEKLQKAEGYQELFDLFTYQSFGRLSTKKGEDVDPTMKEVVKALRDEVKSTVADLKKTLFQLSPEVAVEDMAWCQEVVEELVDLTLAFKERLDAAKRDKNLVDFSDMEHFALQILLERDEDGGIVLRETAKAFQQHFEEIMIDEYQDSNEVQELLLRSISGESIGNYNRFMVGDVKQSIYKFRLARPEIFMEKYNTYAQDDKEKVRIDLSMNFRSRREVTDSTNFICSQVMKREVGNVEYDEAAALYVGASYPGEEELREFYSDGQEVPSNLEHLYQTELFITTQEEDVRSEKEAEAYMVARRIKELIGKFPVKDDETGKLRPARYSDIVILFRATAGWDEEFRKVLTEQGIPVHVTSKTGYFETLEIQGVVNLLKVLDNPLQDIPFYGVLKLPCFHLTEDEIARVRCAGERDKSLSLWEQVRGYSSCEGADSELAERLAKVVELIQSFRKRVSYTTIKELIKQLLAETGYRLYVSALPGGEQRNANIELLLEKAGAFEKTSFYGLFHFIRYLETIQEQEVDFGEANILDENADVVRIMTIHKSKGLEFPICFVSGMAKQFNLMDVRQSIIMDVELGIGVDCIHPELRTRRKTLRKNVVAQRMKEDTRGEDLRVLYVALTRAKEKLILTASEPEIMKKLKADIPLAMEQGEKLPYSVMMSANSYLDLILASLVRHRSMQPLLDELGVDGVKYSLPYAEIPMKVSLYDGENEEVQEYIESMKGIQLEEALDKASQYRDETLYDSLKERFSYQYQHTMLEGLTVKTSVSDLKKAAYEEALEPAKEMLELPRETYIPKFMQEEEHMLGTQYGTAVHKVMELMSFTKSDKSWEHQVKDEMTACMEEGSMPKAYGDCVRAENVARFFESELAKRMIKANEQGLLFKEQPFVLGVKANKVDDKFPENETMLIQGVIDAFFYEGEDIVLLDYKTDRVNNGQDLVDRYKEQLYYYQEALEQITGHKVKERVIYSFRLNEVIKVEERQE